MFRRKNGRGARACRTAGVQGNRGVDEYSGHGSVVWMNGDNLGTFGGMDVRAMHFLAQRQGGCKTNVEQSMQTPVQGKFSIQTQKDTVVGEDNAE
jgi:hypothetical protein